MGSSKSDPRAYPVEHDERNYRKLVDAFAKLADKHPLIAAGAEQIKLGVSPLEVATQALRRLAGVEAYTVPLSSQWERNGATAPRPHLVRADGSVLCHSQTDGDCAWRGCPQITDDEPERSGRHCPLDSARKDDE